jgi:hypothetical protein
MPAVHPVTFLPLSLPGLPPDPWRMPGVLPALPEIGENHSPARKSARSMPRSTTVRPSPTAAAASRQHTSAYQPK